MKVVSRLSLILCLFLSVQACSASPLFNHKKEEDIARDAKQGLIAAEGAFEINGAPFYVDYIWLKFGKTDMQNADQTMSKLLLVFRDTQTGEAISEDVAIKVNVHMPTMSHDDFIKNRRIEKKEDGVYIIDPINFVMGGEWNIDFTFELGSDSYTFTYDQIDIEH